MMKILGKIESFTRILIFCFDLQDLGSDFYILFYDFLFCYKNNNSNDLKRYLS